MALRCVSKSNLAPAVRLRSSSKMDPQISSTCFTRLGVRPPIVYSPRCCQTLTLIVEFVISQRGLGGLQFRGLKRESTRKARDTLWSHRGRKWLKEGPGNYVCSRCRAAMRVLALMEGLTTGNLNLTIRVNSWTCRRQGKVNLNFLTTLQVK